MKPSFRPFLVLALLAAPLAAGGAVTVSAAATTTAKAPVHHTAKKKSASSASAAAAAAATAATPKSVSDAPFWSGHPNAATFARIEDDRLARAKKAIERLLAVSGPHTVENTLQPYDDAQLELDAMLAQSGLMEEVHPDSSLRATAEKATQSGRAYATELSLNRGVYDAIVAIDTTGADDETRFYIWKTIRDFKLAGVDKDEATRKRIKQLSDELVTTGQEFSRNIRSDSRTIQADSVGELAGLPDDYIARHKPDASGKVTLSIEYPDYFPVMTYAKSEALRKRMFMAAQNRAYPANMAVLDSMVAKRYRLANLIGYTTWADYITADKMIGSAKNASDFIAKIVDASGDRMKADYQVLLARKRKDVPNATGIDWWDRFYWPAIVKKEQFDFDAQKMRPYLPYDKVKQGVLDISSRMFGVTYQRVKDAPVWDPQVECWEMFENGKRVGRFYLDMHPRANKYNHAAQFDVRTGVEGRQIPEAALICNLPGGVAGDPGLCEMEDVTTFFHEFGHLLHTLFAGHHRWVGIGGIRTEQDFVEAPSQLLEEWMRDPKVLGTFARHYKTGEAIPAAMVEQMRRAENFGSLDPRGIDVRRQMVLADLSLSIYNNDPAKVNSDTLNARLTNRYTPYPFIPGTHFQCSFGHLDGYSAVYYTYMWSLVIAKDMFSAFNKSDLLDPAVATRYRHMVLDPGGSKPAAKLVEQFLGRPISFEAYRTWLTQSTPSGPN